MAKKYIRRPDSEDFEIMEEGKDGKFNKVGTIRVKPSAILWKPKSKQKWYKITVEQLAEFAESNGTYQEK